MTTYGFTVSQRSALIGGHDLRDLLLTAQDVEASNLFDTVWVGDSLTTKPRPESIACLGALAGITERVRLGIACFATFPVRDPLLFALQWSALDQISHGRMLVTVCTGIQKAGGKSAEEGRFFGGVSDRERPQRLEEYIEVVRRLWTGESFSYAGEFVTYDNVQITPTVQQPAPIWMAGAPMIGTATGSRFFDRVARLADGYMVTTKSAVMIDSVRNELNPALERHGRAADTLPIAAYTAIAIGDDRDALLDETTDFFARYYGPDVFTRETVGYTTIAGTPQQCAAEIAELRASGLDHITFRFPSQDVRGQLELMIEKVLPNVG